MDNELKIILQAEVENQSYEEIKEKLRELKEGFSEIKIKIMEDGNFSENLSKLSKNLELLTTKLSSLSDEQLKGLNKVGEQAKKNAETTAKASKIEEKSIENLIGKNYKLIKTQKMLNELGIEIGKSNIYESKNEGKRLKTKVDTKTQQEVPVSLNVDEKKIEKEIELYKKARKEISQIEPS